MIRYPDFHTHRKETVADVFVLTNIELPTDEDFSSFGPCSVGIHPWSDPSEWRHGLRQLERVASYPCVKAIGECGLDKVKCAASLADQMDLFYSQIKVADCNKKPMIIHNVGGNQELLSLHKRSKSQVPWVLHGFRGNVFEMRMFLKRGFFFSYGIRFNEEALRETPEDYLLLESDEYSIAELENLYERVALIRGMELDELLEVIKKNISRLFSV